MRCSLPDSLVSASVNLSERQAGFPLVAKQDSLLQTRGDLGAGNCQCGICVFLMIFTIFVYYGIKEFSHIGGGKGLPNQPNPVIYINQHRPLDNP